MRPTVDSGKDLRRGGLRAKLGGERLHAHADLEASGRGDAQRSGEDRCETPRPKPGDNTASSLSRY